jgi:hypothetical protein
VNAPSELIARAFAAIDAANAGDQNKIDRRPRAQLQGERASEWLDRLAPDAGDALALAVRAHHLRRWEIPRDDYPDGRAGYLRWRRDLKAVHARAVEAVLSPLGIDPAVVARVQQLVRKEGLGSDPEAQAFEDVVCLVFLETQYEALIDRIADEDKIVAVLRKTLPKMSEAAVRLAGDASLHPRGRELLVRAVEGQAADPSK